MDHPSGSQPEMGLDDYVLDAFEVYNNRIDSLGPEPEPQQPEKPQKETKASQSRSSPNDGASTAGKKGVSLPKDSDNPRSEENIFNLPWRHSVLPPGPDVDSVLARRVSSFQLYKYSMIPRRRTTQIHQSRPVYFFVPPPENLFTNNVIFHEPQQVRPPVRRQQPQIRLHIRGSEPPRGRMARNKKTGEEHFHDTSLPKPEGYKYIKADAAKDAHGTGFTAHEQRAVVGLTLMPWERPPTEAEVQLESFLANPKERGDPEENRMAKSLGLYL